jgi:pimeloyl-ACP methyl ester carboxylesterase
MLEHGEKIYRQLGQMPDMPVLLFWGRDDHAVPFKFSKKLVKAVPQVEFHPVFGAGHVPQVEKADEVNPVLLEFLQR